MRGLTLFFIAAFVGVCAWCPWYLQSDALKLVQEKAAEQQKINKKCILTPMPKTIHKVMFGYGVDVTYDCSLFDNESITKGKNIVVATFLGTVFNMPQPFIR